MESIDRLKTLSQDYAFGYLLTQTMGPTGSTPEDKILQLHLTRILKGLKKTLWFKPDYMIVKETCQNGQHHTHMLILITHEDIDCYHLTNPDEPEDLLMDKLYDEIAHVYPHTHRDVAPVQLTGQSIYNIVNYLLKDITPDSQRYKDYKFNHAFFRELYSQHILLNYRAI